MSVESDDGSAVGQRMPAVPQGGDQDMLVYLYERYVAYLYDYCEGILRNPAAAADAVQGTLMEADAQIGKLQDLDQLRIWLYSIARRQCLRGPRRSAAAVGEPAQERAGTAHAALVAASPTEASATEASAADADTATIDIQNVDAGAIEWETLQIARAALDGLSDRDREVLNLAFRHGFGQPDLAAVLGVSARRARAMLFSASARFEKSATVTVVLGVGYGWAACPTLETFFGDWDSAPPQLTPRLRRRLIRHVGSCCKCARNYGNQSYGPQFLGFVPVAVPPAPLAQRIVTTVFDAHSGAESRGAVGRPGRPGRPGRLGKGGFPGPPTARGLQRAMIAAAVALVVLVGAGGLLYKITAASAAGPDTTAAEVAAGNHGGTPADTSQGSPAKARTSEARRRALPPAPGLPGLSPTPVGVLASPSPSPTGHPKSPSPSPTHHSTSPTPTPTSPSPSPSSSSTSPSPSPSPSSTSPTPTPPPST